MYYIQTACEHYRLMVVRHSRKSFTHENEGDFRLGGDCMDHVSLQILLEYIFIISSDIRLNRPCSFVHDL